MAMLGFLILFPLVVAAVLLAVRNNQARKAIVGVSAAVIGVASIWLVVAYMGAPWVSFEFYSPVADYVCSAVGVLVAAAIPVSYTHLRCWRRRSRCRRPS